MTNTFRFQDIFKLFFAASILVSSASSAIAQGLGYDKDHDVLVLPDCQVAVRYNNKTFVPVKASSESTGDSGGYFLARPVEKSIRLKEDYSATNVSQAPEQIFLECYDTGKIGGMGSSRFSKEFLKDHKIKEITLTSDKVAKETGLQLAAVQALTAVKIYQVMSGSGGGYNIFVLQHGAHMTLFARQMRTGKSELNSDPAVIVTELQFGPTGDSKSNVQL